MLVPFTVSNISFQSSGVILGQSETLGIQFFLGVALVRHVQTKENTPCLFLF